jgi:Tfp pilus assembly protein PilV
MRRGSSLLEALLALLLFEFALLSLLGASAVAARDLTVVNRRLQAERLAVDRVERMRTVACGGMSAGSAVWPGGYAEFWRVEAIGRARVSVDSVVASMPAGRHGVHVERAWSLCPQ